MPINTDLLWEEVWENIYRRKSKYWKKLCNLFTIDTNYSMFVAGIISGIPASLVLNLTAIELEEISRPVLYCILYAITTAASVYACLSIFRFAVQHTEIRDTATKRARRGTGGHGTEEEWENELVKEFERRYEKIIRPIVRMLSISATVTAIGVLLLFVALNF